MVDLLDEIYLKGDIKREMFLSVTEVIDMIDGIEGIYEDNIIDILEYFGVFALPVYVLANNDHLNPLYEKTDNDQDLKQAINNYLNAKCSFVADGVGFDEYTTLMSHLSAYKWSRIDLLKIDSLVKYSGIVKWGESHALKHLYDNMINDSNTEFHNLPIIAQEAIINYLKVFNSDKVEMLRIQASQSSDSQLHRQLDQAQTTIQKLQAEIINLKQQLNQTKNSQPDDKEITHKTQSAVARLIYTLLAENKYDLSSLRGTTNDLIVTASTLHGTPVTRNFVADWIDLAKQAKSASTKSK